MTVHIIGAGLAGLSAAVELAAAGHHVILSESAPQAGGRCRSYADAPTGLTIDNGNHLVLSGNDAAMAYLATIGASDRVRGPERAAFAFVDLKSARPEKGAFTVAPNSGAVPWWIFSPSRRVPGTGPLDYLALAKLLRTPAKATVGDVVRTSGPLWDKLLEPVLLAALNTPPAVASAALTSAVVRGSLARGGAACRPLIAHPTLAAAFVDPALAYLRSKGAEIRTRRLAALGIDGKRLTSLAFADGSEGVDGPVILAVPAPVAATLLPGLRVPTEFNPIISLHFALRPPPSAPAILGVLGGITEWIFAFPDRLSVTISAANGVVDRDRADLAATVWAEVAAALDLTAPLPAWQVVKERRATVAATVEQDALRPPAATATRNLFLAGDWTQTGLPSTIEGAIRSGVTAATLAQAKS
nr:hydroxysqualene dehydroxylase HpnE [Polymorphobacter sp.]